jgi:hypothetical protein
MRLLSPSARLTLWCSADKSAWVARLRKPGWRASRQLDVCYIQTPAVRAVPHAEQDTQETCSIFLLPDLPAAAHSGQRVQQL